MPVVIYPWIVGLVFFIPLDLSFSVWFFYLFAKAQRVTASIVGWRSLPGFPYFNQQTTGGWLGLCLIALWLTRRHLKHVFVQALRFRVITEPAQMESRNYRMALIGFLSGLSFLVIFCVAGGMSFWIAITFFVLLVGLETTVTRIRAELGPPQHELA
ncbi:TPA: hypothetical protein EYN98_08910 [Candidatus Poribacteria bacterium]|nr:hypothetical protein [Candidatus Poribacteria bacterium]HIB90935.1 hypothetical protein [Candidatus Poribacteria bacterium]HIB99351.1 hypothetical protein [Candidatus Poribacteria bacterium]HIN29336.1 hypothetical protein [Candidatus Poribacteria bacterium]HIO46591.1 hypothetical protein [Candidatus Poribacteria bacterium]